MDTHKQNNFILVEELVLSFVVNKYRPIFSHIAFTCFPVRMEIFRLQESRIRKTVTELTIFWSLYFTIQCLLMD